MSYVNTDAGELNISDLVKGRGRVSCNPYDHDTLEGFVVVVFARGGEESVVVLKADRQMKVRINDDD